MKGRAVDVVAALDRAIARNIERGAVEGSPSDRELRQVRAEIVEVLDAAQVAVTSPKGLNRLGVAVARARGIV